MNTQSITTTATSIHPDTHIGVVSLVVADLNRSIRSTPRFPRRRAQRSLKTPLRSPPPVRAKRLMPHASRALARQLSRPLSLVRAKRCTLRA